MTPSLAAIVTPLQSQIHDALAGEIASIGSGVPRVLREAMAYSVLAGGKRIRPVLCLIACSALGVDNSHALPAALSLEFIHTYSLIHDDLPAMDDDDLRRGQPTCHRKFGEATAILAGDGLLTQAFETLATRGREVGLSLDQIVRSTQELASAAGPDGMVGGQQADLDGESAASPTIDDLVSVHRRKTGRLLESAVVLGGIAADGDAQQLRSLRKYGSCIGLAFQIADDLLDETGDEETIGKGVRKDVGRGKATFPRLLGLEESRDRASTLVSEAINAVDSLGEPAAPLISIASYIIDRDR